MPKETHFFMKYFTESFQEKNRNGNVAETAQKFKTTENLLLKWKPISVG